MDHFTKMECFTSVLFLYDPSGFYFQFNSFLTKSPSVENPI